ncbi:hypothetical protein ACVBGC_30275 [Burkholderia stagnalis]
MRSVHLHWFHACVAICGCIAWSVQAAPVDRGDAGYFIRVGEHMFAPPPDPVGTTVPQPTGNQLRSQVQADLKRRFDTLANPSTHMLTAAQARAGGWGYVADHFSEIDQSKTGAIGYPDLVRFFRAKKGVAFSGSS